MKLPEWANWLARDEDYELWGFTTKPSKAGYAWDVEDGMGYCERLDDVDDIYNDIQWEDEEPTEIIGLMGLGVARTSAEELNRIMNAKAHGYDEVPEVADKTELVHVDKDGVEVTVGETTSISFEEAMALVENRMENEDDDIADKRYETPDIINEPNHYKGKHGIETIDVIRNFGNDDMVAGFYWGNAIKYMTRYRNKNGLEDLKKARKNLDWLIEHTEG